MNILSQLQAIVNKPYKRLGRGFGSKKGGHTTGRGAKGDKARGSTRLTLDGTKIKKSWIQRLPKLRGRNKLKSQGFVVTVTLTQLSSWFKKGAVVDEKALTKKTGKNANFKVVSTGELSHSLTVKSLKVTKSALEKIQSAGGKIEA